MKLIYRLLIAILVFWGCVSYLQLDTNPLHWNAIFRFITIIYAIISIICFLGFTKLKRFRSLSHKIKRFFQGLFINSIVLVFKIIFVLFFERELKRKIKEYERNYVHKP